MLRSWFLALFLSTSVAIAAETPASEASIREILEVTEVRKLVDTMLPQMEAMMRAATEQSLQGRELSATEQQAIDRMHTKMTVLMKEELSWEKLEALYLMVYRKTFTQEEVDGMLEFYRSPVGKAVIRKMPQVIQESMGAMQQSMGPMMEKMQAAVQEVTEEIVSGQAK